ncbi:MAG: energy transducer TonB, partial [Alteraurantiacibacter sp.]
MAQATSLSRAEGFGIGAAVTAHIALAGGLWWLAQQEPDAPLVTPPQRIDVSLATEVSLESTAPDPSAEPAASFAPVVTEVPQAPDEPLFAPPPEPRPQPTIQPTTTPRPQPTTRPSSRPTT